VADSCFISYYNTINSCGDSAENSFNAILNGCSGLAQPEDKIRQKYGVHIAGIINNRKRDDLAYGLIEELIINTQNSGIKNMPEMCIIASGFVGAGTGRLINKDFLLRIKSRFPFIRNILINTNACAAGNYAVNMACALINSDVAGSVAVIGIDIVNEFVIAGFESMKNHAYNLSIPFSSNSEGMCVGEGAGILVVSKDRSETVKYAEIAGTGFSSDPNGITGMDKSGFGIELCYERLTNSSGMIDRDTVICSHGTGTRLNDRIESFFISEKFSNNPVVSLKGIIGHTLGGSAVIETALMLEAMQKSVIPQADCPSPIDDRLKLVKKNTNVRINGFIKNSFGFGGVNSAVYYRRII